MNNIITPTTTTPNSSPPPPPPPPNSSSELQCIQMIELKHRFTRLSKQYPNLTIAQIIN
ncbi:hypothetical protein HDU76_008843, partial [Blyttiomyces sp. JEL0837]